jgi:endonuclease YncB( thermonuclease family)
MSLPLQGIATIKSILSGDCVILIGAPNQGPPPTLQLGLNSIQAPRYSYKEQEPFGFQAREYLRNLVGLKVKYSGISNLIQVEFSTDNGRHYGSMQAQNPIEEETNIGKLMLKMGWATYKGKDEEWMALMNKAKEAQIGMWSSVESSVTISPVEDESAFLAKHKGAAFSAIVEQVREGSSLRIMAIPSGTETTYYTFNLSLSGMRYLMKVSNAPPFVKTSQMFQTWSNHILKRRNTSPRFVSCSATSKSCLRAVSISYQRRPRFILRYNNPSERKHFRTAVGARSSSYCRMEHVDRD